MASFSCSCKHLLILVLIVLSLVVYGGHGITRFPIPRRTSFQTVYSQSNVPIHYKTLYFEQQVDHFNYENKDTYKMRYLLADQFWDKEKGPILFYTGNEGDITWFCNNTGFMWDIAPEFKALLVFAEHRYYGQSLPYGKESYKDPQHLGFLTSEQALADFAVLIDHLKSTVPGAADSPVIALGGSYGGMLASWFRMKYPHSVIGALAGSAPIWQFDTPCNNFNQIVTADFQKSGSHCADVIRKSWSTIDVLGNSADGRAFMTKAFELCQLLKTKDDIINLKNWLSGVWVNLAMVDYPYPASFLEPLPAWPIKVVCSYLTEDSMSDDVSLIVALGKAVQVYFNNIPRTKCLNITQQATGDLGDLGWGFQACTEMIMPMCADGIHDMFEPSSWNLTEFLSDCYQQWGVKGRPDWVMTEYGGRNIKAASNIIFSNGDLDPWSSGGVTVSQSESLVAIEIKDGAHHLDLRSSNKLDPPSVTRARQLEKKIMKGWISKHWENLYKEENDKILKYEPVNDIR